METINCLFAHEEADIAFSNLKDRLGQTEETFQVLRCRECGLFFLNPRPTLAEIEKYYPYEAYRQEFAPAIADEHSQFTRWNRRYSLNKLCKFVASAKGGGKLLDVGCGTGNFLEEMRIRGWEVWGLDVNEQAVDYARNRFQMEIFKGSIEAAAYPAGFFDVVTLWNVLEHLHDPFQTLYEIRRVLSDKGVLAIIVPNGESFDARLFGPCWVGLDPPRHLYTFTPFTLSKLLSEAGFQILKMQTMSSGGYHSFVSSAQLFLQERYKIFDGFGKNAVDRLIRSRIFHLILYPYLRAVRSLGKSPSLGVLAVLSE